MRKFAQWTVLMLLFSTQLNAQETQRLPSGTAYKIAKSGGAIAKIKVDDVITFNYKQTNFKDSVLMSSYMTGSPVKIRIQPSQNIVDLLDVFVQLSLNDSAIVYLPTDSLFKGHEEERPPFLPAGTPLVFHIKIERVQSMEDAMAEQQKMADSLTKVAETYKVEEKNTLAKYLADKKPSVQATSSGLLYGITTPSAKAKPAVGDTVFVNYIGRTLEGVVFDTSIEEEAKKAGVLMPGRPYEPISFAVGQGQMIPGWDEGLLLFNEGSKGTLIVPSELAYGERGGGDVIKPFSTLIFDVELVKVNRVAKPAAAPVKKAVVPVKKTTVAPKKASTTTKPAATTVKKPAATTKPAAKPATTTAKKPATATKNK